jgi:hypothetical protein
MNIIQRINAAGAFLVIGSIVTGYSHYLTSFDGSVVEQILKNPDVSVLALYLLLFKIKTLLDDHKHFGEPPQKDNVFRYVGLVLAIISWIFWALAGQFLGTPARAAELMVFSLLISTSWIFVHLFEILADKQKKTAGIVTDLLREKWVYINLGYVALLGAFAGWLDPLVPKGVLWPLVALFGLLAYDFVVSKSYKDVL